MEYWKELGMQPNDVGIISDIDEVFTRDFLLAIQTCDVPALDYQQYLCDPKEVKIIAKTVVWESSPQCISNKDWYHPDIIIGACLEGIGNASEHVIPPRYDPYTNDSMLGYQRMDGWKWTDRSQEEREMQLEDKSWSLWSTQDFRRMCGGHAHSHKAKNYSTYTAFHFHNLFMDLDALRHKYLTYGHATYNAMWMPLQDLSPNTALLVECTKQDDHLDDTTKSSSSPPSQWSQYNPFGGFGFGVGEKQRTTTSKEDRHDSHHHGRRTKPLQPFLPIYFHDEEYQQRKHALLIQHVKADQVKYKWKLRFAYLITILLGLCGWYIVFLLLRQIIYQILVWFYTSDQ